LTTQVVRLIQQPTVTLFSKKNHAIWQPGLTTRLAANLTTQVVGHWVTTALGHQKVTVTATKQGIRGLERK
jgi:hypothetical protein